MLAEAKRVDTQLKKCNTRMISYFVYRVRAYSSAIFSTMLYRTGNPEGPTYPKLLRLLKGKQIEFRGGGGGTPGEVWEGLAVKLQL